MARINGLPGLGSLDGRFSDTPETVDRALLAACAAVWLLVLGMAVAAAVALADLGSAHSGGADGSGTPWLLYSVIAVSVVVIAAAIPLLLRARRGAHAEPGVLPAAAERGGPAGRYAAGEPGAGVLNRIWLRCGFGILTAMGVAMLAVALAAYLLAVDSDTGAWVALGVAALVTVAMAAIPVVFLRQLHAALPAD